MDPKHDSAESLRRAFRRRITNDDRTTLVGKLAKDPWVATLARRFARWHKVPETDLPDLVQDVYVALLSERGLAILGAQKTDNVEEFVWRQLRHRRSEARPRRKTRVGPFAEGFEATCHRPGPDEEVERSEGEAFLRQAVKRLGRRYSETVSWYYLEGWSVAQIATARRVSCATVSRDLQLGKKLLEAFLRDW